MKNAEIIVLHSLPNRIRLHFSEPPFRSNDVVESLLELEGVTACSYSVVTRNILIYFTPSKTSLLDVLKHIVLSLSAQYCMRRVCVKVHDRYKLSSLSYLALISIGGISIVRFLKIGSFFNVVPTRAIEYGIATMTGLAVFEHAAIEINRTGIFDPEAFSVLYLFTQIKEGHPIKGAFWTWIASFGRHLVPISQSNHITFKVIEGVDYKTAEKYTDIVTTGSLSLIDSCHCKELDRKELVKGVFEKYKQFQTHRTNN